jgi:hypothetical protein
VRGREGSCEGDECEHVEVMIARPSCAAVGLERMSHVSAHARSGLRSRVLSRSATHSCVSDERASGRGFRRALGRVLARLKCSATHSRGPGVRESEFGLGLAPACL